MAIYQQKYIELLEARQICLTAVLIKEVGFIDVACRGMRGREI